MKLNSPKTKQTNKKRLVLTVLLILLLTLKVHKNIHMKELCELTLGPDQLSAPWKPLYAQLLNLNNPAQDGVCNLRAVIQHQQTPQLQIRKLVARAEEIFPSPLPSFLTHSL